MKTTKRIMSMILATIMAFGCFSVCSFAASAKVYDAKDYKAGYVSTKIVIKDLIEPLTTTCTYNSKGQLTKKVCKYSEGYTRTETYTYDSKGNLTKYKDNDVTLTYTYDSSGNMTKKIYKYEGNTYTNTYIYDSKGNLTKKYGDWTDTTTYTYDSKGNLIKEIDGSYTTTYTYDNNGNLIKEKGDNATKTFTYDSKGNLTKETFKYSDGETSTENYTNTYNSKGKLTKVKYDDITTTYTYDSNGNLTKKSVKEPGYGTSTTKYSYKKISSDKCIIGTGLTDYNDYEYNICLDYASTTYSGKAKKPNVTINGLEKGFDYTVTYSNNTKPGKGKINVKVYDRDFMGQGDDLEAPEVRRLWKNITITYDIKPTKVSAPKASSTTKNSTKLTWSKVTGATGYVVYKYIAASKKYVKLGTTTGTSYTAKNLKSGTTYKFAVRAYTKTNSGNVYGKCSDLITVKTK